MKHKQNSLADAIRYSLQVGLVASLAFTVAPVWSQDAEEDEQSEEVGDRIQVTGSRLNTNDNIVAPNPVLTVGAEEISSRGTSRIEDLTNQLPSVFAGQASEVSNGASGTSTLNLRGLGSIRTLTLIDGRRLPFGSSESTSVNLDNVPAQLVERIEIVTGGASAVYGSDAIGGVANFILKDDYEGFELDVQYSFNYATNERKFFQNVVTAAEQPVPGSVTDGEEMRVNLTMGANTMDGRGNVTMFFNYEDMKAISQVDRDFSACTMGSSSGPNSFGGVGCVGSSNFRRFANFAGDWDVNDVFQQPGGELTPFAGGPAETYNFGPNNYFQRPAKRYQIYTKAKYELNDNIEAFADLSFLNNQSDAQIAESASFGTGWSINCDNPLLVGQPGDNDLFSVFGCDQPLADGSLPEEIDGIFASHRMVEGGPRVSKIDITTWRAVAGLRGSFADDYDFEVFGQFSEVINSSTSLNDLAIDRVQDGFYVVEDENGNPVCRSGNAGCVPFNIFQRAPDGSSLVTPEVVDYVTGVGIVSGGTKQTIFGGNVQTDFGRFGVASPLADAGLGALVGVEYRKDELNNQPDEISQRPDGGFTGVGGPSLPVQGSIEAQEFYAEAQLPLVTGRAGIENLSIGGAYRYSDYTVDGAGSSNEFDTDTYHVFLNYSPTQSLRLRAQYQRAVRAPNVVELFTPQGTNLPNLTQGTNGLYDPCASQGDIEPAASAAACANTGVTAAQYGNVPDVISGQTQSITGGNPLLDPEVSDTYTYGVIFTPTNNLSFSVDYFDIEVNDAVAAGIPANTTLQNCLASGDPAFCDLIVRDSAGSLISGTPGVGFQSTNINLATLATQGIDAQATYDFDVGSYGSVRVDYAATYVDSLTTTPFPGADPIECAGKFAGGCGAPNSEYRHRGLVNWDTPWDVRFTAAWRYYSATDNDAGSDVLPEIDRDVGTVQYFDLSANYRFSDTVSFKAGINNVLDERTPVITSAGPALGNGNTYPTVFDTGRYIFLGATYSL
ncbi:MAG: TonB-dependent receptor [Wenzhouxiangella sp.]|nr:TonB-dependent receptor [Wenzhouxiangella sp.]